ncbi:MAG: glutamate racemase [Deltaproteobacteria bacterium]|nr:glutamate racemase [Deltaproteobacteria bacterium]
MDKQSAIGVFDSGLGGLTVVRAIIEQLEFEDIVYLGDTARIPYGTRSAQTVVRYARNCAEKLREHDIKLLVVACNTVSAVALDILREQIDLPILGVIAPGAKAAVEASRRGRIGVIGTLATIASGAYVRAITAIDPRMKVYARATPLLVPLAEEGWTQGEVPRLAVRHYFEPLVESDIDVVVLGCTHYPLLRSVIEGEVGMLFSRPISVVDSAQATAQQLASLLREKRLRAEKKRPGSLRLMVTDKPGRFAEVASRFLGRNLDGLDIRQIDLL